MIRRGAFVLLEGVDRSGKSTQCKRLVDYLNANGIRSKLYGFPNRTTVIGQQINQYLQNKSEVEDHCIHLLFSANRWEARNSIMKDLNDGITIICDRYFASGVAFTAAKGYDMEWCLAPDRGLPAPDIILFLNLDAEEQQRRGGFGEERYEVSSFQQAVRGKFLELIDSMQTVNWQVVDAKGTPDEVFEVLRSSVENTISAVGEKPISVICSVCYHLTDNQKKIMRLPWTLFISCIICFTVAEYQEDSNGLWLKSVDDVNDIAIKSLASLKEQAEFHEYDDLKFSRVIQKRKTLVGGKRSVYLKVLFSSLHFANHRAEELVTVLAIQKDQGQPFTFHFSDLPAMNPSFLNKLKTERQSLQSNEKMEEEL